MKFWSLLKKEFKELLTVENILGMLIGIIILVGMGTIMGNIGEDIANSGNSVVIADLDRTPESEAAINAVMLAGTDVVIVDISSAEDYKPLLNAAEENGKKNALIIPKGFGEKVAAGETQAVKIVSSIKSFSIFANMDSSASDASDIISEHVADVAALSGSSSINIEYLKEPILTDEVTVIGDKAANVSSEAIIGMALSQSIFIPIIIFLLLTMATQLNISAIANEKVDKTLETLLSTPVHRLSVLGAKMTASAVFSLLTAAVYMIGFSFYMSGIMGMSSGGQVSGSMINGQISVEGATSHGNALAELGMSMGAGHFALVGIQLFLTIAISLVISLMLGAASKDLKSAQGMITPLMIFTLLPYLITMFADINALPLIGKIAIYLIPFTHTFTATSNLLFGNTVIFAIGIAYQAVFLAAILFVAIRLFSSDKIFTSAISFGKKKKKISEE